MFVVFNIFDLTNYFEDVELPLWIPILVSIFICLTILWAILVLHGFKYIDFKAFTKRLCRPKNNSRVHAMQESLGITKNTLSIEPDGADEVRHTYTHISMRKPCDHIEKFEIRNHSSDQYQMMTTQSQTHATKNKGNEFVADYNQPSEENVRPMIMLVMLRRKKIK